MPSWRLPDTILEVLPKNIFAFRDLTIVSLNPADIRKLIVKRGGRTDELEPKHDGPAQSLADDEADRCARRYAVGHAGRGACYPAFVPTS